MPVLWHVVVTFALPAAGRNVTDREEVPLDLLPESDEVLPQTDEELLPETDQGEASCGSIRVLHGPVPIWV